MIRSREEITKQCGELIDTIGELFDEKIKYERKFCEESRKRKEAETELAKSNFKLEKAINYLKEKACYDLDMQEFCRDLIYDECLELLKILEGTNE